MEDENPPVRRLTLKAKEIVPTDPVARTGDGTAISVQLMHRVNRIAEEKHAAAPPRDPFLPPADAAAITVDGMLQENLIAAAKADPGPIAMPAPRKSRRRRDFALVVTVAAAATGILVVVFRQDPQVMALGLFGIVFTTSILAWVVFGIMDPY